MQHRGCINGHRGVDNYVSRKKQHSRKTNIESNRKNIVSVIHVRHMNEWEDCNAKFTFWMEQTCRLCEFNSGNNNRMKNVFLRRSL